DGHLRGDGIGVNVENLAIRRHPNAGASDKVRKTQQPGKRAALNADNIADETVIDRLFRARFDLHPVVRDGVKGNALDVIFCHGGSDVKGERTANDLLDHFHRRGVGDAAALMFFDLDTTLLEFLIDKAAMAVNQQDFNAVQRQVADIGDQVVEKFFILDDLATSLDDEQAVLEFAFIKGVDKKIGFFPGHDYLRV